MNFLKWFVFGVSLILATSHSVAGTSAISTIADYDKALPSWGAAWGPGSDAINGYYPSFYTGFAVRSQFPDRIHIRLARGNQTRVSVALDEQTVTDYIFDLAQRNEFYKKVTKSGFVNINPKGSVLPQFSYFSQVVESPAYGIPSYIEGAKSQSPEGVYAKSLEVLTALNPGRVFNLHINLKTEFNKWKAQIKQTLNGNPQGAAALATNPQQAIIAIDSLLWGRVNITEQPSAEVLALLTKTAALAASDARDEEFFASALPLFLSVTGNKYSFKVMGPSGKLQSALQCANANDCFLSYPEFTAIYPTGSVMSFTQDQFNNKIVNFASPGLWTFYEHGSPKQVDNIRNEPYYGWIPKMDYESIFNGFHDPAVLFRSISSDVKQTLGIHADQGNLWAVKRGGVSHGCSRMPAGGIWELRHILPVESKKMTQVHFFNNAPQDFDVYDIDGDGQPEVMGVAYFISYGLQGTSDVARREGADLEISNDKRNAFYTTLYGAKNVFTSPRDGEYVFINPTVSVQSYLDYEKKKVGTHLTMNGKFRLYEQDYQRDKIQFYSGPINKTKSALMGRVRGCAPTSDKEVCGAAAFEREAQQVVK